MNGWCEHKGKAIVLDIENVDTDQLIPARFMSTSRADGYGSFLLHDMRLDNNGALDPDFPLNRYPNATVLVGRRNFGSGSSREAAVYALVDFGFRAVIAPNFGDIFESNSVNNGLLPACVEDQGLARLISLIGEGEVELKLDILEREITVGNHTIPFNLSEAKAQKLVNGWDDIDLTVHQSPAISTYRARRTKRLPWVFPAEETAG